MYCVVSEFYYFFQHASWPTVPGKIRATRQDRRPAPHQGGGPRQPGEGRKPRSGWSECRRRHRLWGVCRHRRRGDWPRLNPRWPEFPSDITLLIHRIVNSDKSPWNFTKSLYFYRLFSKIYNWVEKINKNKIFIKSKNRVFRINRVTSLIFFIALIVHTSVCNIYMYIAVYIVQAKLLYRFKAVNHWTT